MTIHPGVIGIDVSKNHLDIFDAERGRPERLPNSSEAAHALAQRLQSRQNSFAIFEATGNYDRHLRKAFDGAGARYHRLNPQRARDFARAIGRRAKNDTIDARMLMIYGQTLAPLPTPAREPARERLAALHQRRDQLVDIRATERTRLTETTAPCDSLESHLAWLDAEIARFDRLIADAIASDTAMAQEARLLISVPGVGPVTATTLIALMPELGTVSPKAAAAIAGLAPWDDDTGKSRGIRRIGGGRRRVRRALYMAAVTAARSQSRFKQIYQHLRDKGKPAKVALIAIARKMLIILNAIIRDKIAFQK